LSAAPETRLYKDPTDLMKGVGMAGQNLSKDNFEWTEEDDLSDDDVSEAD
jgi:hypothetical protein